MHFDNSSRLTGGTSADGSRWQFVYDGLSRLRISRQFNSAGALVNETRRVYNGMDVVQERDGNNNVTVSYTRTGNIGGLLCRTMASGPEFYGYDGSGNITSLTNAAGSVFCTYAYDAWGNSTTTQYYPNLYLDKSTLDAAGNHYTFSSKEQLAGMSAFGFRFYSPGLGRWINRDPIRENGGTNVYGFVNNSPTSFVDRFGLTTYGIGGTFGGGFGLGGGVGGEGTVGYSESKGYSLGLHFPISWGAVTPQVGSSVTGTVTTGAGTDEIVGSGGEVGFSAGEGPTGGMNVVTNGGGILNPSNPTGLQVTGGVGIKGPPIGGQAVNTYTFGFGYVSGGSCGGGGLYVDPATQKAWNDLLDQINNGENQLRRFAVLD